MRKINNHKRLIPSSCNISATPNQMYKPIFRFYVQFEGQLCEEQTQKMRKPDKKTTPLWQSKDEMVLKSRDPKSHI